MKTVPFLSKVLAISRIGQIYTHDDYARENYEELEQLARETFEEYTGAPVPEGLYARNVYVTPNVSVRVLVFNDAHKLLMVKEKQDGGWAVPGGWCDVFDSSSQAGIKEVKQEANLDITIDRLLGVFQREKYKDYPALVSEYVHYYSGSILKGELKHNHETTDIGFFDIDQLPELSKKCTIQELSRALAVYQHKTDVQFD